MEWFREQKARPCADCGIQYPAPCMDFDHRDPTTKSYSPSNMMGKGMKRETIAAEIAKCDVVCANCHRIRTHREKWVYRPTEIGFVLPSLKAAPCSICHKTFPPECMDFDHRVPAEKEFSIAKMGSYSLKHLPRVMVEIEKCDLTCHNCHRLKHSEQWQSYVQARVSIESPSPQDV